MNASIIVAMAEEEYRVFLIGCDSLQLNPVVVNSADEVKKRCEEFRKHDTDKKNLKLIDRFEKNYQKYCKISYNFHKRTAKLVEKKKITFNEENFKDDFVYNGLVKTTYESYLEYQKDLILPTILIVLGVITVVTLIVLAIVL